MLLFVILLLWIISLYLRNIFYSNKTVIKIISYNNSISNLLLPRLNVFSPNPASSDIKIFYRDLYDDKTESQLKEIIFYKKNDFFLFNINLRNKGFLTGLVNSIRFEEKEGINSDKNGRYTFFKKIISKKEASNKINTRQIIFLKSYGYIKDKKEKIVLIDYIYYK